MPVNGVTVREVCMVARSGKAPVFVAVLNRELVGITGDSRVRVLEEIGRKVQEHSGWPQGKKPVHTGFLGTDYSRPIFCPR